MFFTEKKENWKSVRNTVMNIEAGSTIGVFSHCVPMLAMPVRIMARLDADAQLRGVQSEICRMDRIRDPEKFFPYFPKGISDDTCSAHIKQEKRMDDLPGHGDTGWCFFRVHGLHDDDQFTPRPG